MRQSVLSKWSVPPHGSLRRGGEHEWPPSRWCAKRAVTTRWRCLRSTTARRAGVGSDEAGCSVGRISWPSSMSGYDKEPTD